MLDWQLSLINLSYLYIQIVWVTITFSSFVIFSWHWYYSIDTVTKYLPLFFILTCISFLIYHTTLVTFYTHQRHCCQFCKVLSCYHSCLSEKKIEFYETLCECNHIKINWIVLFHSFFSVSQNWTYLLEKKYEFQSLHRIRISISFNDNSSIACSGGTKECV